MAWRLSVSKYAASPESPRFSPEIRTFFQAKAQDLKLGKSEIGT